MAKHTERRAPRASFIVTMTAATSAMALAVMPGCGSTVGEGSSSGTPSGCPAKYPPEGTACTQPGLECNYMWSVCPPVDVVCESGAWHLLTGLSCRPPPYECPQELPAPGSSCEYIGATCYYSTGVIDPSCGNIEDVAQCGADATWSVSFSSTCNRPPQDRCTLSSTEVECLDHGTECRWLVPGCADATIPPPALAEAGCFPIDDCASDGECWAGTTCQARVYNPCYNQACNACGATAMLCMEP